MLFDRPVLAFGPANRVLLTSNCDSSYICCHRSARLPKRHHGSIACPHKMVRSACGYCGRDGLIRMNFLKKWKARTTFLALWTVAATNTVRVFNGAGTSSLRWEDA